MSDLKKAGKLRKRQRSFKKHSSEVSFVDPQPSDRYNLAFYAKYSKEDIQLGERDRAYLTFFHKTLPALLNSDIPWSGKKPSSRATCECQLIKQVSSLEDLFRKMTDFIHEKRNGKFGTIFISAHGDEHSVSLPIADGSRRVTLEELAIGLSYADIDCLSKEKPPQWNDNTWNELKKPFIDLKFQFFRWKKANGQDWFDKKTLVRFWLCFLGAEPKANRDDHDTLKLFGKLLSPNGQLMLEAPKTYSIGGHISFSKNQTEKWIYELMKKKNYLHPDVITEVEHDQNRKKFAESELEDARNNFVTNVLERGPSPIMPKLWVPTFGVQPKNKSPIFPGKWNWFRRYWRRVKWDGL